MLTIKRFFAYSLVFHITVFIIALLIVSSVKGKRGEEFFARLVSPEEFLPPGPPASTVPRVRPFLPPKPRTSIPTHKTHKVEKGTHIVPEQEPPSSKYQTPSQPLSPPTYSNQAVKSAPETSNPKVKGGDIRGPNVAPSIREKLFDRNIIGDAAKREIKKEEQEKRTFSFDAKELKYLAYLSRLKERIESIWIYPPDAVTKGLYGDLIIKFTIKKNGRLGAVELVRTSGYKNLDDAALRALRDAEPFWPLPNEWGMDNYTIEGHFIYTIYGYYVR